MSGYVLIDKPEGFTSFDAVAVMRRTLQMKRIGHTGTLDPMATGLLILLTGRATQLCELLPCSDKRYTATLQLGVRTDTFDRTGTVLERRPVSVGKKDLLALLPRFTGEIDQAVPSYSAVSVGGKRLYELARAGKNVERPVRSVTIRTLTLLSQDAEDTYTLDILCSKGTYIRSLAEDLGRELGCGAMLTALRRTEANGFSVDNALPLEQARALSPEQLVRPVAELLSCFPQVRVSAAQAVRFANGGALDLIRLPDKIAAGKAAVFSPDGTLIGLGEALPDEGMLKMKCLL